MSTLCTPTHAHPRTHMCTRTSSPKGNESRSLFQPHTFGTQALLLSPPHLNLTVILIRVWGRRRLKEVVQTTLTNWGEFGKLILGLWRPSRRPQISSLLFPHTGGCIKKDARRCMSRSIWNWEREFLRFLCLVLAGDPFYPWVKMTHGSGEDAEGQDWNKYLPRRTG